MEKIILKERENLTLEKLNTYKESFIDYIDVDELTLRAYKVGIKSLINYFKENKINSPTREDIIAYRDMLRRNFYFSSFLVVFVVFFLGLLFSSSSFSSSLKSLFANSSTALSFFLSTINVFNIEIVKTNKATIPKT